MSFQILYLPTENSQIISQEYLGSHANGINLVFWAFLFSYYRDAIELRHNQTPPKYKPEVLPLC